MTLFFTIGLFEFTEGEKLKLFFGKNGILDGKASNESKRAHSSTLGSLVRSFGQEDEFLVMAFTGSMVR
jgi:hypothetical protein